MTGWRVGSIIAPPNIIKAVQTVNDAVMFTAPAMSQRGAIYAIRNRKTIQPPIVEEFKKRMIYAAKRINAMKNISCLPPRGAFYLLINIKGLQMSSEDAHKSDTVVQKSLSYFIIRYGFASVDRKSVV